MSFALASIALASSVLMQPDESWLRPPFIESERPTRTTFMDGNVFLAQCRNSEVACKTYVQGVNDALFESLVGTNRDLPYCIPERANIHQVYAVIIAWMERNPQHLHNRAPMLIAVALAEAWPQCGKYS